MAIEKQTAQAGWCADRAKSDAPLAAIAATNRHPVRPDPAETNGIIDPHGNNNIAIAAWKTDGSPDGLGTVSLINVGSYTLPIDVGTIRQMDDMPRPSLLETGIKK